MSTPAHRIGRRPRVAAWITESLAILTAGSLDLLVWANDNGLHSGGVTAWWIIPAGSIATLATLPLRHRLPLPTLAVQLVWAGVCGVVFSQYTPIIGILVVLNTLARRRHPVVSLAGWLVCMLPCVSYARDPVTGDVYLPTLAILMIIEGSAWLLGYSFRINDRRTAERDAAAAAAAAAIRSERLRIARELHDNVAHAVSVMVLQSAGARAVLVTDPARAEAALDIVQDVGKQSMNELRRLLCLLRSAADDNDDSAAAPPHDVSSIDGLLTRAEATGLRVGKRVEGTPEALDPSVGLAAYRIVQEAITNTLKHAGQGSTVEVGLVWAPGQLTVTVRDQAAATGHRATGTPPLSTGHGLLGLRERVQTVGGTLRTGPTTTGFLVHAVLPTAPPSSATTATIGTAERILT